MDPNSTSATYILIVFVLVSMVVGALVIDLILGRGRRARTARQAEELRIATAKAAQENAERLAQEHEAALAEEALRLLNSPDWEKRTKERAEIQVKETRARNQEMQAAAERAHLLEELAFEPMKHPVKSFVSASELREIALPERTILLQPGSYEVHFSAEGNLKKDPKSITGLSCSRAQIEWRFVDEKGTVWEMISDLAGDFFSRFSFGITMADTRQIKKLHLKQEILKEASLGSFQPSYEFWMDANQSTRAAFQTRGIVQGLCSGLPFDIPDSGLKVRNSMMPLAPAASWVCYDLAWDPEKAAILVREYGWMSPQNKPLPVLYYQLPLGELCPLTWHFSWEGYKGNCYRDLLLLNTRKQAIPQSEIRVV